MPFDTGGAEAGSGAGAGFGGAYGYFTRPRSGKHYLQEALSLLKRIQEPDFDMRELSAPQLEVFAELFPEQYQAQIEGTGPALISDSPETRAAQMESLGGLQEIGREGLSHLDQLLARDSQRALADENKRAQNAILENLRQRGTLGGGSEIAARIGQGQESAELSGRMGSDLARMALERRLQGLESAGSLAGTIRGQDVGVQAQNAGAIGRFNEFMSNLRTGVAAENARARGEAAAYNVGTRQRTGEQNRLLHYGTELENLERKNRLRQAVFENKLRKTGAMTGVLGSLAGQQNAEQQQY